nr:reverse transcriptase domain-containing protein [Tanacetum cinerariifolium]
DQDSLNSATDGNLLERRTQDVLTIIENKSKVYNSRNKLIVSQVKSSNANSSSSFEIAKLTHAVNPQISAVTTAVIAILKQFQAAPPPASVKAVEEICVTCGGAHPCSELEKIKRMNEANMKAMQTQINNVKNELWNEMKNSIQASMSNQTNKLKNMMASFFQMNTASTSGSGPLSSNTIADPKGELKAITTRSGIVLDGPFVYIPPPFINLEEDKHVEDTLTDQDLAKFTIKVPPPLKMLKALLSNKEKLQELFDIESDLKEIEYPLHHDPIKDIDSILKDTIDQSNLVDLNDNLVDSMPEMFTDEHALDYSSPSLYDEYADDDLFKVE